jgi:hypothetical protein
MGFPDGYQLGTMPRRTENQLFHPIVSSAMDSVMRPPDMIEPPFERSTGTETKIEDLPEIRKPSRRTLIESCPLIGARSDRLDEAEEFHLHHALSLTPRAAAN